MEMFSSLKVRQIVALLAIFIISILHGEARCQEKSSSKPNRIHSVKIDPQSGKRWINPKEGTRTEKENPSKAKFDQQRFDKELNTLKKISAKHELLKRLYESRVKAEQESSGKKVPAIQELERIKLFDKATPFYKSPAAPKPVRNSFLSKNLVTNVLVNGKTHDTISLHDAYSLTFSFAPNCVSAVVNIYIDANNNGVVSSGDFQIVSNGLMMDNSEDDEDPVEGSYKLTFSKDSGYRDFVSSLIFEVNDYQSVSSAAITIEQKPNNAVILGTITPPLQNMMIMTSLNSSERMYAFTDSSGKFKISIDRKRTTQAWLMPFDVFGIANGYLPLEQQILSISSDTTEANFPLTLATAFIEGYVKDQNGAVIKNAAIRATNSSFASLVTKSDSLGFYKLGVTEGTWRLEAEIRWTTDYIREDYSDKTVSVLNNSTVQQDFLLIKANSTISGKVFLNTNGVGGIPIYAGADSLSNSVLSSATGNYELPVYKPSSEAKYYNVNISVPDGYYALTPAKQNILPGTTNVNFEIKKVTGGIDGKITDSKTGEPIPNAYIYVSGTNDYRHVYSNDSGYYRMTLPDGIYYLDASTNIYYNYSISNIVILGGMVTKNITLVRSGSFSGSLKDEDGKPVYNASIMAMDSSGNLVSYGYSPDENGNYTLGMLKTSKYSAYVDAYGYVSQWYNRVPEKDSATFFQVFEGYDTPNIDFVLTKGGSLSGRVANKSGKGISGVEVDVFDSLSYGGSYAVTNDSGYYSVRGLATGMYFVRVHGYPYYTDQYYNGVDSREKATMVHVVINQNTPDINFVLSKGASISGVVKDKNNIRIPYIQITILDSSFSPISYVTTNGSGYYFVGQLNSNKKYYVTTYNYGYTQRWYNNVSSPDSATAIILQEEEKKENIDFTLSKAGAISGRVLDYAGKPIPYFSLTIEDSTGNNVRYGYTDTQGKYTISNLSNGKYYAKTFDYRYEEQWFDHKTSKLDADIINVVEEETTENINFDPLKPGEIPCDSIQIKIELANGTDSLYFSQGYTPDYLIDCYWSILFNVDRSDTSGKNGFEIEISLYHYKKPGDTPFKSTILNATTRVVMEWFGNQGFYRHSDFSVWKDPSNKNTFIISVPKTWAELNKIDANTKYYVETYYYANNGSYLDLSKIGNGSVAITDPAGDVPYNFIDIISASWQIKQPVSVSNEEVIPESYSLSQNYPNPFNPTTTISYSLPVDSRVTLTLYNMLGEVVLKNEVGDKTCGNHLVQMNLSSKASGVYFYELEANPVDGSKNFHQVKKMILMK